MVKYQVTSYGTKSVQYMKSSYTFQGDAKLVHCKLVQGPTEALNIEKQALKLLHAWIGIYVKQRVSNLVSDQERVPRSRRRGMAGWGRGEANQKHSLLCRIGS